MPKKEEAKKFKVSWKLLLGIATILLLITFFAFFFGVIKKTCKDDRCFNDALKRCRMANYLKLQNYNYYRYSIEGGEGEYCKLNIKLVKMAAGTPQDKIDLFEGKSMTCKIPRSELSKVQSDKIEGVLKYCTGPLKEAMYQLIIEKLYTLIIANMGEIIGGVEETLAGQI